MNHISNRCITFTHNILAKLNFLLTTAYGDLYLAHIMQTEKKILVAEAAAAFKTNFSASTEIRKGSVEELFEASIRQVEKFAVGNYFWFIADAKKGVTAAAGGMLEKLLPIAMKDFVQHTPEILFRNIHLEDLPKMIAFSNYWITKLCKERRTHVRPTIYIRLLSKAGAYHWMMIQFTDEVFDNKNNLCYGFTLVTDISHIKKEGPAMMSLLNTKEESCQLFYCNETNLVEDRRENLPKITPREMEVLKLLSIGYSSKQIAGSLKRSIKTIDNHRQNLLRKTSTKTTGGLVAYGISMGYI